MPPTYTMTLALLTDLHVYTRITAQRVHPCWNVSMFKAYLDKSLATKRLATLRVAATQTQGSSFGTTRRLNVDGPADADRMIRWLSRASSHCERPPLTDSQSAIPKLQALNAQCSHAGFVLSALVFPRSGSLYSVRCSRAQSS